jgi:hypothetical protein
MRSLRSALVVLAWAVSTPSYAQLEQLIKQGESAALTEAENNLLADVAESAGVGAPILLDQTQSYPTVPELANFHPRLLQPTSIADLMTPLAPGDYSMEVRGYCTRVSMHAPSIGTGYKLAPLNGKQSAAVGALLVRGELAGIGPGMLQGIVWNIEAGQPLQDMIPTQQAVIHQLIPEYEQALKQDFLADLDEKYEKYRALPNLPSLDQILGRTPEGQYLLTLKRQRDILKDRTISAENQADRIYQPTGDGLSRVLPVPPVLEPSPWSQIRPNVWARLTVQEGFSGRNLFEFRVTANATSSPGISMLRGRATGQFAQFPAALPIAPASLLGMCAGPQAEACVALGIVAVGVVAATYIVAYPISRPAQPLTLAPILQSSSGSGTGAAPTTGTKSRTRTRTHTEKCDDRKLKDVLKQKNIFCKTVSFSCANVTKCGIINRNIEQAYSCLSTQQFIQTECYAPGDPEYDGHKENVDNTQRALDNCLAALKTCVP